LAAAAADVLKPRAVAAPRTAVRSRAMEDAMLELERQQM